jgi:hypothetical protein
MVLLFVLSVANVAFFCNLQVLINHNTKMKQEGTLEKMHTLKINPVQYFLKLDNEGIPMNEFIGRNISLRFTGNIYCTICNKKTYKSFGEGLCYNCFANAPENAECILRPELCLAHEGKGRNMEWEIAHHVKPHFVYLALVDQVKVGVTRETQIPTRWIDQGANQAIILAETPYRQLAGLIEVKLKAHFTDKTNWIRMLRNEFDSSIDLAAVKERVRELVGEEYEQYISPNNEIINIEYPVLAYTDKIKSIGFDKMPEIERKLIGIRGQYLIFESGEVINVRKHSGYQIVLQA